MKLDQEQAREMEEVLDGRFPRDRIILRLREAALRGEEKFICPETPEEQEFILESNPFLGGDAEVLFFLSAVVDFYSKGLLKMVITSSSPRAGAQKIVSKSSFVGDFAGPCIKLEKCPLSPAN